MKNKHGLNNAAANHSKTKFYSVGNEALKCHACEKKKGSVRAYEVNDKNVDLCSECLTSLVDGAS